jgi:hypothetical protein
MLNLEVNSKFIRRGERIMEANRFVLNDEKEELILLLYEVLLRMQKF